MYFDNSFDALSLDAKITTTDGSTELIDIISDGEDMMEDLDMVVRTDYLEDLVNRLEGHDKQIIINYYGLQGVPALSLKEIGDRIGISRERVRQRHNRSMLKLRVYASQMSSL